MATEINYSSSNNEIASVNAFTGQVNVIAEGSTIITAIQPIGIYNSEWYEADTVSYTLHVAPRPTLILDKTTLEEMTTFVGNTTMQTINVSGINLTDPNGIGLEITGTDANLFSLSKTSIPQTEGTSSSTVVTIMYAPFIQGAHTATLTLSSLGAINVTRSISGSAIDVSTENFQPVSGMILSSLQGEIRLYASAGEKVEVYNAIGQKIIQKTSVQGLNLIHVSSRGLVIVKVGNRLFKVIL
jgi:hypothetical protein